MSLGPSRFTPRRYRPSLWLRADRGVYQDAAVQFTAADKSWLQIADAAQTGLGIGTDDGLFCWWVWVDSLTTSRPLFSKDNSAGKGYQIYIDAAGRVYALCGDGTQAVAATPPGTITTGKWWFVAVYADRSANLSIYAGDSTTAPSLKNAVDMSARSGNIDTGVPCIVGAGPFGAGFHDGRIDSLMFFKSPDLSAVAADIIAWTYNAGAGRLCSEIAASQKTAWGAVSGWEMIEDGGTRADSWGSNHLAERLGDGITKIARAGGIARAAAVNGDGISYWDDQSSGNKDATQLTLAKRPELVTAGINSRPVLRADGVDDYLGVSALSLTGVFAISAVFQCAAEPSAITLLGKDANNYITLTDNTTVTVGIAGASQAFTVSAMGTDPHILTVTRDADNAVNVYLDGTVSSTGAKTVAGTLALEQVLAHGSEYFAGDLAEVLVYDGAKSAAELARLHTFLARRYGITI